MRRLLAALVLVLALTGCDDAAAPPGETDVAVDTAELRELKAEAGIEPCVPGTGDGGLPDLTLPCLGGGDDVNLSGLDGPLVINVWNTYCIPCRKEMPVLQEFHERYGGTVRVVGLDATDTNPEDAIAFAGQVGATYPQVADPGGNVFDTDLGLRAAFPQLVFVDAEGEVAGLHAGAVESLGELVDLVEINLELDL